MIHKSLSLLYFVGAPYWLLLVATTFNEENIATVSQQLSWSHLIELSAVENETKRLFYNIMGANQTWGVRKLREEIDTMALGVEKKITTLLIKLIPD